MRNLSVAELAAALPVEWVGTYVRMFEQGRVQKYPQARFVNAGGECCLVAALVGAASGADVVGSAAWTRFRGSELEELSRRFESRRLTAQQFYEECVLQQITRTAVPQMR